MSQERREGKNRKRKKKTTIEFVKKEARQICFLAARNRLAPTAKQN